MKKKFFRGFKNARHWVLPQYLPLARGGLSERHVDGLGAPVEQGYRLGEWNSGQPWIAAAALFAVGEAIAVDAHRHHIVGGGALLDDVPPGGSAGDIRVSL